MIQLSCFSHVQIEKEDIDNYFANPQVIPSQEVVQDDWEKDLEQDMKNYFGY